MVAAAHHSACVLLVDGFEETEAVTVIDVLRRAGVRTAVVGVESRRVVGSHDIAIDADATLADVRAGGARFDAVVLPGGMPGAASLRDSPEVRAFVVAQHRAGAIAAAICAAPIALAAFGLLDGKRATCFPGFEAELGGATFVDERVVDGGDVITSRAVGTALSFSLALVARLSGPERADELQRKMLVG